MRALVIGGNGFIGSHLIDALLENGWQVVVYDRVLEKYRLPLPGVQYVLGDLENLEELTSVLAHTDVMFHLASTTIPETANRAPIFDIQSNLVPTVRLLELCVKYNIGKVIFLSSGGTVYGVPEHLPVGEDHPTQPISAHAIVKLSIEKYLFLFKHLYGLNYVILRPANPYGPRQNPQGKQGAVAAFLGHIAQNLPITIWGTGEVIRDFLHVSDLASACISAATITTESSVFNIGSGHGISLNQLIAMIEREVQRFFQIERLPARPFDVPEIVLDTQRAQTELGWSPKISLEDGLADTWHWICSLPDSQSSIGTWTDIKEGFNVSK